MKITIFGLAGTGTTTVGKILAKNLDYEFLSTGNMFRQQAEEMKISLNELEKLGQLDSKYDLALDQKVKTYGEANDNFIFDSRLAWYFIPDSIKIKLACDYDARLERIMSRENKDKKLVEQETEDRLQKINDRYKRYYDIDDYASDTNFDMIIDTTNILAHEVASRVEGYLKDKTSE